MGSDEKKNESKIRNGRAGTPQLKWSSNWENLEHVTNKFGNLGLIHRGELELDQTIKKSSSMLNC